MLISGSGSNLQAIIDACEDHTLSASVQAVITNNSSAYGLERARKADLPAVVFGTKVHQQRADYDAELAALVERYSPDLVILAGWMRILRMEFLKHFPGKVINLHPALPGTFPATSSRKQSHHS